MKWIFEVLCKTQQDATKQFDLFHKPDVLQKFGPRLLVGELAGAAPPVSPVPKPKKEEVVEQAPSEPSAGPRILTPNEAAFGERISIAFIIFEAFRF